VAGDHLPSISAEKGVRLLTGRALHVQRIDSLAKAEPDYYHPLVILKVGAHAPIWNRVEELSGLWSCSIFVCERSRPTGCLPAICKSISEICMIKIAALRFYLSFSSPEWQAQMYGNG